jgi:hypothetical protein
MLAGEGMHGAANGDLLCLGQFLFRVSRFRDIKHIEMEQLMRGICPLDQRHNGSFDVARTSAHGRASVPQAKQHLNPASQAAKKLETEVENYRGPATIRLPAGQTLTEWLASHPGEFPQLAGWLLRDSRNVRFADDVEFVMAKPLRF